MKYEVNWHVYDQYNCYSTKKLSTVNGARGCCENVYVAHCTYTRTVKMQLVVRTSSTCVILAVTTI